MKLNAALKQRIKPDLRRSIVAPDCVTFEIPLPPSVNALYANIPGKGRIKTKVYRAWLKEAGWEICRQRVPNMVGPVSIALSMPINRRRDCDNALKPLCDLLVELKIIPSDLSETVRSVSSTWVRAEAATVTIARVA